MISNTWFEKKESSRHTWTLPDGKTKNQIDFILVSQRYRKCIKNSKARTDMDCRSDHKPIFYGDHYTTFKNLRQNKTKKWNKEALKDEEIKINFTKGIEEKLLLDEENDMVDGFWKKLKESITVVAEKICGTGRQEKKQLWIINIMLKMEERRKLKLGN